jgi:hypothetical protein
MRALMGLIKDRHGTYCARRKVPQRLQEAVASILDNGKGKQVLLKRSLGTKALPEANVRAKPVLMEFDQLIARAEYQLKARPLRSSLSDIEIKRIADFFLARALAVDEERRIAGKGDDLMFVSSWGHDDLTEPQEPGRGLSPGKMKIIRENTEFKLATTEDQLARADTRQLRGDVDELLNVFHINLDPKCADYFKLARAVQAAFVKYLRAVLARQKGEPIASSSSTTGSTATAEKAISAFLELKPHPIIYWAFPPVSFAVGRALHLKVHGDLPIVQIKKSQVNEIKDPPRVILHVATTLPENPGQPDFSGRWARCCIWCTAETIST